MLILTKTKEDYITLPISSQLQHQGVYDHVVNPTIENGIKIPSLIRATKITTLSGQIFHKKLGTLNPEDRTQVKEKMKQFVTSW